MGISDSQKTAIWAWVGVTAFLWSAWLVVRLLLGGQCEQPDLVQNFKTENYIGRWYEMYREKSVPFESEDCATATYRLLDNNFVEVNNVEYSLS